MSQSHDIVHQLLIKSTPESVFKIISTANGFTKWWSEGASGHSELGGLLELNFGPDFHWQAQVTQMMTPSEFEVTLLTADPDWVNTRVGFQLSPNISGVEVRFYHKGWKEKNQHYYISCYCWAMYLRLMKRHVEYGEFVEYSQRLEV